MKSKRTGLQGADQDNKYMDKISKTYIMVYRFS